MQAIGVLMTVLAFSVALGASPVSAGGIQDEINQAATIMGRFQAVTPEDILSGKITPPAGAERLRQVLAKY